MERTPEPSSTSGQMSEENAPVDADGQRADKPEGKPWWKRHGSDIAWVLGIVLLWQTGGLAWLQAQLLRLTAPAPKVEAAADAMPALPESAWDWRLRRLDGPLQEQFFSLSDFRGRPLFVNRWATWCGPCRAELPSIRDLHAAYGEDLAMLLITDENPEEVRAWLEKSGYADLPVYRSASAAPAPFDVRSIPASWLVHPDGRILAEHQGAARWDAASVRSAVDAMLAETR